MQEISFKDDNLFFSTGLSIHTFHGNFFVRSTDLVSLPNVSPDSGFSMQIDIEDSLTDSNLAVFQSALLYTSTKGNLIRALIKLCGCQLHKGMGF